MFHKFKYYLLDSQGRSYYLDNKGNVKVSATPTPLKQTPDGWQNITIAYERDLTKLGVVRSFTLPLAFVRNASKIVKHIVYSKGLEEKLYLLIQRLKNSVDLPGQTYTQRYEYLYKGEIDTSTFLDIDVRTQISISEGGVIKLIKANEGTTYENSLDDPEAVLLKHDGVKLYDTAKFIETPVNLSTAGASGNHYIPLAYTVRTGNAFGFAGFQVFGDTFSGTPTEPNYIFATEGAIDFRISGSIALKYNGVAALAWRYTMVLYSSIQGELAFLNPNGSSGEPPNTLNPKYVFNFSLNFQAVAGEKFYIYGHWTGNSGDPVSSIDYLDGSFEVFFGSKYSTSYVKCFKLSNLGKRLIKNVTGNESDLDSTFLEANDNLLLTSGDGLRGLTGAKIKTSLNDYTQFVRTALAAGQGVENGKLLFAEFEHFLKTDNPITLDSVADFKTSVAKEFRYNTVKIGWPSQDISDINGKYSFNNSHTYQLPTSVSEPKELNITTKYISCCYYQEIKRINLNGKTTVNDEVDNEVNVFDAVKTSENISMAVSINSDVDGNYFEGAFSQDQADLLQIRFTASGTASNNGTFTVKSVIQTTSGYKLYVNENIVNENVTATLNAEYYIPNRPAYSSITGVPDDGTVYNVELSPKRLFLKHKKWINSVCYKLTGQKVKFLTTEKNADLVTTLAGTTISEKSDYEVTDSILFYPFFHEFIASYDLIESLENEINTPFIPEWYGDDYNGFLVKAGTSPNDNKAQQFKILAAPNSDLTKLIF